MCRWGEDSKSLGVEGVNGSCGEVAKESSGKGGKGWTVIPAMFGSIQKRLPN
jgi:hypothetical protein